MEPPGKQALTLVGTSLSAEIYTRMPYTALLLDLDHTLLDSGASEALAFEHALASAGVTEPARHLAAYIAINRALWTRVECGEISPLQLRTERFAQLA